jgi:hypothetical protein
LTATQAADVDLHQLSGAEQPDRKMMSAPIVGGQKMPRSSRSVTADAQSHLKVDGILPGVTYCIEDARLRESNGRRPTENLMRENVQIIPAP